MTPKEAEKYYTKKYGRDIWKKMEKSKMLVGITATLLPNGEVDIPDRDLELAYKDITGKKIYESEWD